METQANRGQTRHRPIDRSVLTAVLHYGAPLNVTSAPADLPFDTDTLDAAQARRTSNTRSDNALIDEGIAIWRRVCRRAADQATQPLLLPLSAGLDSRAILAGLRENDVPLHTVTYGVYGAFDYELAPHIARRAGASHDAIDLNNLSITRDRLKEVAARSPDVSIVLDMFFNHLIPEQYGNQHTYINGFAGDALAGNNLNTASGVYWPEAVTAFARWHRASRTITLTHDDMDPLQVLPDAPWVSPELMPSIQQLDFAMRQQRMVRPIVCAPGVTVSTPFLDPEWCVFMLGLPDEVRQNRAFFQTLFQRGFPDLFSLPTTASGGLPLGASKADIQRHKKKLRRRRRLRARLHKVWPSVRVPPADRKWQYLDFRTELRGDTALAALFADSMQRLDEQAIVPWIDAQSLLAAHRAGEADHFKALNVLMNLELLWDTRPELLTQD